ELGLRGLVAGGSLLRYEPLGRLPRAPQLGDLCVSFAEIAVDLRSLGHGTARVEHPQSVQRPGHVLARPRQICALLRNVERQQWSAALHLLTFDDTHRFDEPGYGSVDAVRIARLDDAVGRYPRLERSEPRAGDCNPRNCGTDRPRPQDER